MNIRIKIDHTHIKELLSGNEIEVQDRKGNTVNMIASDDGIEVYRKACNEALDKMEESLVAWYGVQNKND